MNNLIIVALIILACYTFSNMAPTQSGGGYIPVSLPESGNTPYLRQYRELDNVDNVLNRPVYPPDASTASQQAANTWKNLDGTMRSQLELVEPSVRYLDFDDIKTDLVSPETVASIETKQPYFLDESLIIDYYGKRFYWDWRYPREPLPIEFAEDPDKYVKENPNLYPSYVIISRNHKLKEGIN